jgi:[ribosomal protein S5]-alanine N-acetyltransferase
MSWLSFRRPPVATLSGARIILRVPTSNDFAAWCELRRQSRAFLAPWEPKWGPDEFDRRAWRSRLRRYREEIAQGTGIPFLIFMKDSGQLAGGITLGNIRHGVAQTAQIGYWVGEPFAGRGLMLESVGLVARFAFETLRLHRLEAACIPDNQRSIRVLEKAGFRREGLLRSYLRINGDWQDHYLYALISGEQQGNGRG